MPSGAKPLDTLLSNLMEDSRVTFFLMPLLANTRAGGGNDNLAAVADRPAKRQKQETQMVLWTPPSDGKGKDKKGKGKSKGAQRTLPAPGGQPFYKKTKTGKSICPDFNSPNGFSAGAHSSGLLWTPSLPQRASPLLGAQVQAKDHTWVWQPQSFTRVKNSGCCRAWKSTGGPCSNSRLCQW